RSLVPARGSRYAGTTGRQPDGWFRALTSPSGSDALGVGGHTCFGVCRGQTEDRCKLPVDVACNSPTAVDERRKQIDAGRAGAKHGDSVITAADAAVALDLDASARVSGRPFDIFQCRVKNGAAVQRSVLCSEARLGHRPSAADLQALDAGLDAPLDHLGEAIVRSGGIV